MVHTEGGPCVGLKKRKHHQGAQELAQLSVPPCRPTSGTAAPRVRTATSGTRQSAAINQRWRRPKTRQQIRAVTFL